MDDDNDLKDRDLSGVADQDLSPDERNEIRRRMDAFVERMQKRRHAKPDAEAKPAAPTDRTPKKKRLARWAPKARSRRG